MAGIAKDPFTLDQRPGSSVWRVRFSHKGRRYAVSTGTADKGEARTKAREVYLEALNGKESSLEGTKSIPVVDALVKWKAALPAMVSAKTAEEYGFVGDHWPERWTLLYEIDNNAVHQYSLDRLCEVTRATVRRNRSALSCFLGFCAMQGWLDGAVDFSPLPKGMGNRVIADKNRIPLTTVEVEELLRALTGADRNFYTFLWETAWRPSTVCKLDRKTHAPCYGPRGKKAGLGIWVTPEIEKSRNATRGKRGQKAWVPLSNRALNAWHASTHQGLVFGEDDRRAERLKSVALQTIGREVTEYDFKHSRITQWFRAGKDPLGISYASGVALDTLIKHYAHPGEEAARLVVG